MVENQSPEPLARGGHENPDLPLNPNAPYHHLP